MGATQFAELPVVAVVIVTRILQKYSLKQSIMQIFYVSLFYFPVDSKLENRHDKVHLNCKKNITEKFVISKKLTFIEIIKQIETT